MTKLFKDLFSLYHFSFSPQDATFSLLFPPLQENGLIHAPPKSHVKWMFPLLIYWISAIFDTICHFLLETCISFDVFVSLSSHFPPIWPILLPIFIRKISSHLSFCVLNVNHSGILLPYD